jgi:hypothetical protein
VVTVGETYQDANGRELLVTVVQPGDPLGREVLGVLLEPREEGDVITMAEWSEEFERFLYEKADTYSWYATTLLSFQDIWTEQAPTWKSKTPGGAW